MFLLTIIGLIIIPIILFDLYVVFIEKSYSRILYYTRKYSRRAHNYYIRQHKIIMIDIDDPEVRDYDKIQIGLLAEKIYNIMLRETRGIISRLDTYKTRHGRHIIIFLHNTITTREALIILDYTGADEKYKELFLQKGYFTLFQVRRGEPNINEMIRYENKNGRLQELRT